MILRSIPRAQRMASIRGRVMIDTVRGVLRVRKWPKKRGTPKSALQRFWIDWFTQANLLAKYVDGASAARAIEMTKGTGLYPRDVLLEAMRGRLYWWADETGWKWFPMAATQDVSNSLDTVAQTVGSILVRALDRWRALPPGVLGYVLTHQAVDEPPIWQAPSGGDFVFAGALVYKLSNQSIANGTFVAATFTAEEYDTAALHDNVVNPSRMTVPAGWSRVRLYGGVSWQLNSTGERIIQFRKNGAAFRGLGQRRQRAINFSQDSSGTPAILCEEGDYFEMFVYQTSGSAKNLEVHNATYFAMERVT